jgi:hypothetical protein
MIGTSSMSEVEINFEVGSFEGPDEVIDMKTNILGSDSESESPVTKEMNIKKLCRSFNGGLEDDGNLFRGQTVLALAKGDNKEETLRGERRMNTNRGTKFA